METSFSPQAKSLGWAYRDWKHLSSGFYLAVIGLIGACGFAFLCSQRPGSSAVKGLSWSDLDLLLGSCLCTLFKDSVNRHMLMPGGKWVKRGPLSPNIHTVRTTDATLAWK